ncbi:MAG: disulfide bond formation protein B, partial [Candidatus Dadabacteria bacterium]|nr:disulfide bond formation protein B [Candidatus Dadabacteria bacterium]
MTPSLATRINSYAVLGISGVLLGAYYIQFVDGESPCPLCLLQRIAMLG